MKKAITTSLVIFVLSACLAKADQPADADNAGETAFTAIMVAADDGYTAQQMAQQAHDDYITTAGFYNNVFLANFPPDPSIEGLLELYQTQVVNADAGVSVASNDLDAANDWYTDAGIAYLEGDYDTATSYFNTATQKANQSDGESLAAFDTAFNVDGSMYTLYDSMQAQYAELEQNAMDACDNACYLEWDASDCSDAAASQHQDASDWIFSTNGYYTQTYKPLFGVNLPIETDLTNANTAYTNSSNKMTAAQADYDAAEAAVPLGDIAFDNGDYKTALSYYTQAITGYTNAGDKWKYANDSAYQVDSNTLTVMQADYIFMVVKVTNNN